MLSAQLQLALLAGTSLPTARQRRQTPCSWRFAPNACPCLSLTSLADRPSRPPTNYLASSIHPARRAFARPDRRHAWTVPFAARIPEVPLRFTGPARRAALPSGHDPARLGRTAHRLLRVPGHPVSLPGRIQTESRCSRALRPPHHQWPRAPGNGEERGRSPAALETRASTRCEDSACSRKGSPNFLKTG